MVKRVFLICSYQSIKDSEILETISTELKYTIDKAGLEARVNTVSDLKSEKLAIIISNQYSSFPGRNVVVSSEFISDISLWCIKDILEKSDVLILVSTRPSAMVCSWLSAKNAILSETPITYYPKIDSLLARQAYFG